MTASWLRSQPVQIAAGIILAAVVLTVAGRVLS